MSTGKPGEAFHRHEDLPNDAKAAIEHLRSLGKWTLEPVTKERREADAHRKAAEAGGVFLTDADVRDIRLRCQRCRHLTRSKAVARHLDAIEGYLPKEAP